MTLLNLLMDFTVKKLKRSDWNLLVNFHDIKNINGCHGGCYWSRELKCWESSFFICEKSVKILRMIHYMTLKWRTHLTQIVSFQILSFQTQTCPILTQKIPFYVELEIWGISRETDIPNNWWSSNLLILTWSKLCHSLIAPNFSQNFWHDQLWQLFFQKVTLLIIKLLKNCTLHEKNTRYHFSRKLCEFYRKLFRFSFLHSSSINRSRTKLL